MREKPEPYFMGAERPAPVTELPQIDMPVIDIQDLEHKADAETRVPNKGLKVTPRIDSADERDLAREDEDALDALEELEKTLKRQAPG